MVITWYGQACFRIQSGSTTIVIDPFQKKIGLNPPKIEAQLVLITHHHADHNNASTIKGSPFIVDGPGEFDYQGVQIQGIESYHDNEEGQERGLNTIYTLKTEGIRVAHLGDLGQLSLTEQQINRMGTVDVLMVPVGGTYTIDGARALKVVNQIEPHIVIPMHYKVKGLTIKLDSVTQFLKEVGQPDVKTQEKLILKKSTLPQEKMEVVVLKN